MGVVFGSFQFSGFPQGSVWLFSTGDAGFVNRPTECGASNVSCNRESKMGLPRLQLLGINKLQENNDSVLCDVIAGEGGKTN